MSEDGCVKAALDCVEETPGNAKTVLSVKNYCEDYATKDQLEEIKEMMLEIMKTESECQEENVESKDEKEGMLFSLGLRCTLNLVFHPPPPPPSTNFST